MKNPKIPEWAVRGKTISQLIEELSSFENKNLLVEISVDDGVTSKPISLVVKRSGMCMLLNCEYTANQEED
ncbi:hypothetical protein [Pseudomonas salmasensis]|uniref:hypothetical protein n=1 Tax=Pseudomonas salmasensis TaxID=2745514 RepID=UPI001644210F|nr:hypothetical protein [Pseudomonas salmasensis]QXH78668.1 hypothetical protein HU731_002245 [Pseudomonas salmasensis]